MKRQTIRVKKQNYAAKFMQLVFLLWCYGVVTKAESIEPLGKNASVTIIRPRPTTVVADMNSSKTALLSQMTFVQNHSSVPHNDLIVKSTIRPSRLYETSTTLNSNWTGNFAADSSRTDIWLIMVVIAGGLAFIIIASGIVIAPIYRKRKNQRRRTYSPNTYSLEMCNMSTRDDYPPSTPADVERPVHLDGSLPGPAIVGNNNPVCIDDESEANTSSYPSGAYINLGADKKDDVGESCEDLGSTDNDAKNRRATMISDAVLANASARISGFGDCHEDFSFHTKNGKNLEEIHSNSPSATSTITSGIGESVEDLSLDGNYRWEIMHSDNSTTSTNFSDSGSSGIGESWDDLSFEATYDQRYISRHMSLEPSTGLGPHHMKYKRKVNSSPKTNFFSLRSTKKVDSTLARSIEADSMRGKISLISFTFKHPPSAGKLITKDGGVIKIDDVILSIAAGCLAKSTEIALNIDNQDMVFKSLFDLDLVDAPPRVVECLPDGLQFAKPADLTFRFEKPVSDSELFVLHGSNYNCDDQDTVWELMIDDTIDKSTKGFVKIKISGFCIYSLILTKCTDLPRILCHLNRSFTCCAYAFYRRLPLMDTIDISVVITSEFVDERAEDKIKQLKDHCDAGYTKAAGKGMLKRVRTKRFLEISLDFPGLESTPFQCKIDEAELDKHGYVVDHFNGIAVKKPAIGKVKIMEVHRSSENKELWTLNVCETNKTVPVIKDVAEKSEEPDSEPAKVVYREKKITNREISRMSHMIGVDWDSLAGLLDIPYSDREEIRVNHAKYPDFFSKAERIFALFNSLECFGRNDLEKCVEELGRNDLKKQMLLVQPEAAPEEVEAKPPQPAEVFNENVTLRNEPLSSREMYRLSRRIVDWDSLAGLMDIAREQRDDIQTNPVYYDIRARTEKILSVFNCRKGFSREKLVNCLKGIQKLDVIDAIKTGKWRKL